MNHIASRRYVVRGVRDDDGRRWAIYATDKQAEAERVMLAGVVVDARHRPGVAAHDRRKAMRPARGRGA